MSLPAVTVIIPTIADARRELTIRRAIDSVVSQEGVRAQVLVVVNGAVFERSLVELLRTLPGTSVLQLAEPSMPAALIAGRRAVQTPFFGFLDDDDELLPEGLCRRVRALEAEPQAGFLISNGLIDVEGKRAPAVDDAAAIRRDPLMALMDYNWLCTSASGLYRSDRVDADLIEAIPRYLEWTYVGARLLTVMPCVFLDEATYCKYELVGSVSRSEAYRLGIVDAIGHLLALPLPPPVRLRMLRKLGDAHHSASVIHLERGDHSAAWRHHLRSLRCPGGLRYATYTRHLLV